MELKSNSSLSRSLLEYFIIFIGYSISDPDVQQILGDVVECLSLDKIDSIQKKFCAFPENEK